MKPVWMACLVAANRVQIGGDDKSKRVARLLMEPNFALLISRHMDSVEGAPVMSSMGSALEAIIAHHRHQHPEDVDRLADLDVVRTLLVPSSVSPTDGAA